MAIAFVNRGISKEQWLAGGSAIKDLSDELIRKTLKYKKVRIAIAEAIDDMHKKERESLTKVSHGTSN